MNLNKTDIVIIGAGIAGLSSAIYLSGFNSDLEILIINQSNSYESNTALAQGGIAIFSRRRFNFKTY
jgi:aspartate oxidase